MNIKALLAFKAVVSEGSVAAAAKELNRSQPAISRLISQLEHELKLRLFHRTRRRLLLTEHGQAFYRETERILNGLHEIPQIARDIRERGRTDLRIVAMPRAVSAWVAPATAEFHRKHPDIHLSIDVQRRHDMENWLAGRHYDLGVGILPTQHVAIDTVEIFRAPVGAVLNRGHPLARRAKISSAELLDCPLIGLSAGLLPREQMDYIFRGAPRKPQYDIETSASYLACDLAAESAGVAVLDTISAGVTDGRTVCVRLEPREWVSFGLLTPKQSPENEASRLFADELRAIAAGLVKTHQVQLV